MTAKQLAKSIACCGLLCSLCSPDGSCSCRLENQCGKKSSPPGCFQYECCNARGFAGCWECPDFSCDKDMFDDSHLRVKVFVKCIKEDGIDAFSRHILRNLENGILYHRDGYKGDYDLDTEEAICALLRNGKQTDCEKPSYNFTQDKTR